MTIIDSSNAKEHSYATYGRQFKSYRWFKPLIVCVLFFIFYLLFSVVLMIGTVAVAGYGTSADTFAEIRNSMTAMGYDSMDLANPWQSVINLGTVAVMIPALWLASAIVRDRPFSSYSSSRGGWNKKVFRRALPVAFVCISLPIIIDELFIQHHIDNYHMGFTLASFAVVTILGPLQCIAEEYAFRGLLMQTFGSWFRVPVLAILLQAVVFVMMHPYNTIGKIGILVSGIMYAASACIGRGIEISSAYHICNNLTIFYLQGLNISEITSESTTRDLVFDIVCTTIFTIVIFIISKRTNWFNKVRHDDAAAWNQKIDDKIARKEAKKEAKAGKIEEKRAEMIEEQGAHAESMPGKHFKQ